MESAAEQTHHHSSCECAQHVFRSNARLVVWQHLALAAEEGTMIVRRRHVARAGQRLGHGAAAAAGLRR